MEIKESDPVFQIATDFVNQTSQHIFLTGKAGTGKTTFLKHIRSITYKNCIVAAPTGVAAVNAEGVTLHSLFQLPFEPYLPGTDYNNKNYFRISRQKLDMLRRLELLIIDEVSMLRADVLDSIDALLRRVRRNSKPFGGLQMLYIGDLFQLPPVVKDEEWAILGQHYASPFFFHAKAIQQAPPVYLELKKVYRQREQSFVELLNRVRNNAMTQEDLRTLNQHYQPMFTAPEGKKYITLTTRNAKADAINSHKLASLTTPAHKFAGKIEGEFPDYSLPTDVQLTLKEGAQIMFIKNDLTDHRYFNGKIGTISRIRNSTIEVLPEGSNDEIVLGQEQWKNIRYTLNQETGEIEEEELGTFTQYPVRLAWAITIHKSQGLTFEQAVIDTGDAFAPGQAYVALSRCTSLDGIVLLSRITPNSVQTDEQALNLAKSEKAENELQQILEEQKRRFWTERLLQYFDCSELIAIPRRLNKLLEDKLSEDYHPARVLVQKMLQQAYDIQEVARKFQAQLKNIVQSQQQTDDLTLLSDRCRKAVVYFHQTVTEQMLKPLQQYLRGFKVKKAKTFYKNVCILESDLQLFLENMKKVRYNDVLLIDKPDLPVPEKEASLQPVSPSSKNSQEKFVSKPYDVEKETVTPETFAAKQRTSTNIKMDEFSEDTEIERYSIFGIWDYLTFKTAHGGVAVGQESIEGNEDHNLVTLTTLKTGIRIFLGRSLTRKFGELNTAVKLLNVLKNTRTNEFQVIAIHIPEPDNEEQKVQNNDKYFLCLNSDNQSQAVEKMEYKYSDKEKQPRIPSSRQSFDLFREGLSTKEIAKIREINVRTIVAHLAEFVQNGELSVTELVPQDVIDQLSPTILAALAEDNQQLAPIREIVGQQYSYSEIRLVMSHLLHEQDKQP